MAWGQRLNRAGDHPPPFSQGTETYRGSVKGAAAVLTTVGVGALVAACSGGPSGRAVGAPSSPLRSGVTALYARPIRLPKATGSCPVSGARPISIDWGGVTGGIRGYAAGSDPVWLVMAEESVPVPRATVGGHMVVNGAVVPLGPSSYPKWGALKTVWLSLPTYQGPYLVRGERLDGSGPMGIGDLPTQRSLLVPPGVSVNGGDGYRPGIGYVWLREPGCYGFQIDGTTFSHTVVVFVLPGNGH
jgi:hypothetical protein